MEGDTYVESDWIRLRDPESSLADAWTSADTLKDGQMSLTDVSHVLTSALVASGWNADLVTVPGVSHSLGSDESRALIVDLIF